VQCRDFSSRCVESWFKEGGGRSAVLAVLVIPGIRRMIMEKDCYEKTRARLRDCGHLLRSKLPQDAPDFFLV